jgi:hypothetical protein
VKLLRRQIALHVAALLAAFLFGGMATADTGEPNAKTDVDGTVSYYQQIRPILQANFQ